MSSDTPPRAGVLGRVSHDKSGVERSVAEQQDGNRAECAANGWQVTGEYEDAVSASRFATKAREDWPRLLADIEAGRLDVVVMWDPSRGSREPEDWFGFLRRCREHHVLIHVFTHHRTYDMANPRDWRTLADDGIDSAYESEKKSRDVKRALAANAAAGRPHAPVRYGYRRVYDPGTGRLNPDRTQEPVPEQAEVVEEIIRRVAAGEPLSVIRDDLNRRVLSPKGGKWHRSVIREIALSEVYIGKRRVGGGLVDATWPAIVSEATWQAARAVLTGRPGAGQATRPGSVRYLLSYIMTCAPCGTPVAGAQPGKGRASPFYVCANPHSHCVSVPMAAADAWVTAVALERCTRPDIYGRVVEGSDEQVIQARNEAARLRAELDEWAAGDISARAYAIKEAKLLPLIGAAERRAVELSVPLPLRELAEPGADVAGRWEGLTVAARREVVRLLLAPVVLHRGVARGARLPAEDRITFRRA